MSRLLGGGLKSPVAQPHADFVLLAATAQAEASFEADFRFQFIACYQVHETFEHVFGTTLVARFPYTNDKVLHFSLSMSFDERGRKLNLSTLYAVKKLSKYTEKQGEFSFFLIIF